MIQKTLFYQLSDPSKQVLSLPRSSGHVYEYAIYTNTTNVLESLRLFM